MTDNRMTLQALPEAGSRPQIGEASGLAVVLHRRIETVEALWREMQADPLVSLHHGFDWCKAWMCTHPAPVMIVEGKLDGRTIFLLPLEIARRSGVKIARFIAADFSNINTGLFAPDLPPLDPKALSEALQKTLGAEVDLIRLENMALAWRGSLNPLLGLDHTVNQNHAFQMPLLGTFEETLKQVNAKRRRKKYRLQMKRLEEVGGYELVEPTTPGERHALLEEFFRQKAERFRTQGLPDVFRDKPVQDFFHALIDAPSTDQDYALRLHGLKLKGAHDGTVLAIAGLSRKGDHVICQFGSIREDLHPETSPGEFLFWHVIEKSCESGAALFDFGIGDQVYKRSWCTVETVQYDLLIPLSAKGKLAAAAHRGRVRLKSAIKQNPRLYALIQRLRAGPKTADTSASSSDED